MCQQVDLVVHFGGEAFATLVTVVGLKLWMCLQVAPQVDGLRKHLTTEPALSRIALDWGICGGNWLSLTTL